MDYGLWTMDYELLTQLPQSVGPFYLFWAYLHQKALCFQ